MKKFRYATVQRVRTLREQQQQRAFAEKQNAWNEAKEQVRLIDEDHEHTIDDLQTLRTAEFDARRDQVYLHHLGRLAQERTQAEGDAADREREMAEQREIMLAAMRDRRMMDKLHDKHREREQIEADRRELDFLNEITIQRHGRMDDE